MQQIIEVALLGILGTLLLCFWVKKKDEEKVISIITFVLYIIGATFLSTKYLYYDIKLKKINEIEKNVEDKYKEIYEVKENELEVKKASFENKINDLKIKKSEYEEKSKLYYSLLDEDKSFPRLIVAIEKLKKENSSLIKMNEKLKIMSNTKDNKNLNPNDIVKYDISKELKKGENFIDKLTKASLSITKIYTDNTGLMNLWVPGKKIIIGKSISPSLVSTFEYKEKSYKIYIEKINYFNDTFTVRLLEE